MQLKTFTKYGITSKNILERFKGKREMPYQYEIIQEIQDLPEVIYDLEKVLHRLHKDYQYNPLITFNGKTECYAL